MPGFVIVQGRKVPEELQFKSIARICKAFHIKVNPNWSLDDVKDHFRNSSVGLPSESGNPYHLGMGTKAVFIRNLPVYFTHYDMIVLINLMSDFNTRNANFCIDLFQDDNCRNTGDCLIRFLTAKFSLQVFGDLQGLSKFDENIEVCLDVGNQISYNRDLENPLCREIKELNQVIKFLIRKQHQQMPHNAYDYTDVASGFAKNFNYMQIQYHTKNMIADAAAISNIFKNQTNVVKTDIANTKKIAKPNIQTGNLLQQKAVVGVRKDDECRVVCIKNLPECNYLNIIRRLIKRHFANLRYLIYKVMVNDEWTGEYLIKVPTNEDAVKFCKLFDGAILKNNRIKVELAVGRDFPETGNITESGRKKNVLNIKNKHERINCKTENKQQSKKPKTHKMEVEKEIADENIQTSANKDMQNENKEENCRVVCIKNLPKCNRLQIIRRMVRKNCPDLRYRVYEVRVDYKWTGEHLLRFPTHDDAVKVCDALDGVRFKDNQIVAELAVGRVFPETGTIEDDNIRWYYKKPETAITDGNTNVETDIKPNTSSDDATPETLNKQNLHDTEKNVKALNENLTQGHIEEKTENNQAELNKTSHDNENEKPKNIQNESNNAESQVTFKRILKPNKLEPETISRSVVITNLPKPVVCHPHLIKHMIDTVKSKLDFLIQLLKMPQMYLVEFETSQYAEVVCSKLDGMIIGHKTVSVKLASCQDFYDVKQVFTKADIVKNSVPKRKSKALKRLIESWTFRDDTSQNSDEESIDDAINALSFEIDRQEKAAWDSYQEIENDINHLHEVMSMCDEIGPFLPPEEPDDYTYGLSPDFLKNLGICAPLRTIVVVKKLHPEINEENLYKVFTLAGVVRNIKMCSESEENAAKIEFDHPVEAVQAISMFHEQILFNNKITVQMDTDIEKRRLPIGLSSVGKGLGKNGEPLKGVRVNIELINAKDALVDAGRMEKTLAKDKSMPFKYTYTECEWNNAKIADVDNKDSINDLNESDIIMIDDSNDDDGNDSESIQKLSKILASKGLVSEGTDCKDLESLLSALKNNIDRGINKSTALVNSNSMNANCDLRNLPTNINIRQNPHPNSPISTNISRELQNNTKKAFNTIQSAALLYSNSSESNYNQKTNINISYNPFSENQHAAPLWELDAHHFERNMQYSNQNNSSNHMIENLGSGDTMFNDNMRIQSEHCSSSIHESRLTKANELAKDASSQVKKSREKSDMLIFKNLPWSVSAEALCGKLREVGDVLYCELTGAGRALVRFSSAPDADRCRQMFHHSKVNGQVIDVTLL